MARYTRHKSPRQFNLVSVPIYLALIGAIYAGVQFGHAFYKEWEVKSALGDSLNRYLARSESSGLAGGGYTADLQYATEQRLRQMGVTDQGIRVRFVVRGGEVTATARYRVVVRHPLINKTTVLSFAPSATQPIRRRGW